MTSDLRFGLRLLRRNPLFTVVALSTIAVAVGANTAIFSIVHGVLLRPLGFPDEHRLVVIGHESQGAGITTTTPGNFYDWQAQTTVFESMAAFAYTTRNMTGRENAERLVGIMSAGSVFDVLTVGAELGRTFRAAEDDPAAEPVVVLSYPAWQRLFGLDRSAIGRPLVLNGVAYTIIGVMPPGFRFPAGDAEYWIPARFELPFRDNRDQYFLRALGRLRPDATPERARAELAVVMDRLRAAHPQSNENVRIEMLPLHEVVVSSVRTRLLVLAGAVAFVLLIACANLANLLLARAAGRRREIAMRQALGAGQGRVMRQLLIESVSLAAIGGSLGLGLGHILLELLIARLPADLPRLDEIALDPTVLSVGLGVSLLAGLLFGMGPAAQLARTDPAGALRSGERTTPGDGVIARALVVSEMALATMLLVGAVLLLRSFTLLQQVDPGFRVDRLLTFRVSLAGPSYVDRSRRLAFFESAVERLSALPGVHSVAIVNYLPVAGRGVGAWFTRLDRPSPADRTPPSVPYRVVNPEYFATVGIPILRGRRFTRDDRLEHTPAVIVSETLARQFFPGEDPLGRQIYLGAPDNRLFPQATIVGVAADVKQVGLDGDALPVIYAPHALIPSSNSFAFVLRTAVEPESLTSAARATLHAMDGSLPVYEVQSMEEVVAASMAPARLSTTLIGAFSAVALALAAVGVFGVLSCSVGRRRRELGIRMALGASGSQIRRQVLGDGLRPVLLGAVLGIAGALALGRTMSSLLFGVSPTDPALLGGACALLTATAALASYVPARRASAVDPLHALRAD